MKAHLWIIHTPSTQIHHGEFGHLITICCSNKVQIDLDIMYEVFREKFNREPHLLDNGRIGVFDSIEDLRLFGFELALKLGVEQLNVHSSYEFQQIIAEINDISELKNQMCNKGEKIPVDASGKQGLWGRIFN